MNVCSGDNGELMVTDKVVYLLGAGATEGEIVRQGMEGGTLLSNLGNEIYTLSEKENGKYWALIQEFALPTRDQDIELIISLLESDAKFNDIAIDIKRLYRKCLLKKITKKVDSVITCSLLYLHKEYGKFMGDNGEELLGVLTTNNDSLIERAWTNKNVFGGLNLGYPFESEDHKMSSEIPPLLKLHGSFNWKIEDNKLTISDSLENVDGGDFTGWVPPSVFKKPEDRPVFKEIWAQAKELLVKSDVLRVVGSSMRTEDLQLLSLVFSSQLEALRARKKTFEIPLIIPEKSAMGDQYQPGMIQRLRFLTGFKTLSHLSVYSPEGDPQKDQNPYYYWMTRKFAEVENKNPNLAEDTFITEKLFGGN